jgi:hypothetical protein
LRWKLLVIASLAATVAGAGLCTALVYFLSVSDARHAMTDPLAAATLILPLASIIYATIFVYRHTARRRKLQATLTALFSLLLTIAALIAIALCGNQRLSRVSPQETSRRRVESPRRY